MLSENNRGTCKNWKQEKHHNKNVLITVKKKNLKKINKEQMAFTLIKNI